MIRIDNKLIQSVSNKAKSSPRKRMNHNFHKEDSATLQRMLNVLEYGTYIQPHKHEDPDKVEVFMVLKGRIAVIEFDEKGKVIDHIVLDSSCGDYGVEVEPKVWHCIICLDPESVAFEVKDGPYNPNTDKNFASWAPKEGSPDCEAYINKILLKIGIDS